MIRILLIAATVCLFSCTDNNDTNTDMSEQDMTDMSSDMVKDFAGDMPTQECSKDGISYKQGEEVCLARQLFECDNGTLKDLSKMCGEPFDVDIQISNVKGMSGQVGGIDSVYITGTVTNLGTQDAKKVECFSTLTLQGNQNASKVLNIETSTFPSGESAEIRVTKNTSDIGNGKTATFEYECTAENEDEEAKSIGNYKKITFTY